MGNTGHSQLLRAIRSRHARIAVVGLGYVGLPLAVAFAKKGFRVVGVDVDRDRISRLHKKLNYISDVDSDELRRLLSRGALRATADCSALKDADAIFICVPTPLKRRYTPNITYIIEAVKTIAANFKGPCLLVLESTTYPGTTEEIILPILRNAGLIHGKDFYLCFSPERIDPGNASFPVHKIPKIIGGVSPEATKLGSALYSSILPKVVAVSSPKVAEMAKLLENTFRLVNIALIDELAMMAHKMKVNIWEVIEAAKTKPFGFMPFYPGPGVGGHCIPKDPLYLFWKAKHFGFHTRCIKLASEIIHHMPEYVVERVQELLAKKNIAISKAKVLVVGVTYKRDVKDLRKSPSIDIISELKKRRARGVSYYDPFIPFLRFEGIDLTSVTLDPKKLRSFDCAIIATDHSAVDYAGIARTISLVFDTRNVYKGRRFANVVKL